MGFFYVVETLRSAKQSKRDLAIVGAGGGSKGSQLGKDNNSEPARIIFRGLFPL